MDYNDWIDRERRIRLKILKDSPVIRNSGIYRVCNDCGEVCLCHEQSCPNCNGRSIKEELINNIDEEIGRRIRCMFRFEQIS